MPDPNVLTISPPDIGRVQSGDGGTSTLTAERVRLAQLAGRMGIFEWLFAEDRIVWTPELEALYGVPPRSFGGRLDDWRAHVVPEDADRVIAEINGALAGRRDALTYEFRAILPDASTRWLAGQASFTYEADGTPRRMIGVNIDVDDRKREQARDAFLVRLDDAARAMTDPDQIVALSARLLGEHLGVARCAYAEVELDRDAIRLTGNYTRPGIRSIVGEQSMAAFGERFVRMCRADEPYVVHDVDDPASGVEDPAAYRAAQIAALVSVSLHKDGRCVAGMAVHSERPRRWRPDEVELLRTVASRCWESIERARISRSLRAAGDRFRHFIDALPQLAWTCRADGWIDWYNRRWYEYTGTTPADMEGWGWKDVHDPAVLPGVMERWEASIRTGEPFEMEFPLRRADGLFRTFLTRVEPLRDANGTVVQWFGTNTDVEQRQQLFEAEREARAEAERVGRMKDEFLNTLSHELRTPLNAIMGWAQLLRRGKLNVADQALAVETIERNVRVQTQMVDDLLDMSRIISGKVRLDVQRVALADTVDAALNSMRPAAEARKVRLEKILDPHAGPVSGDPARLQQVVWNLLSNAIKFTQPGGKVQVVLERVNSHLEISVGDTGVGIKPEFLPFVFDRFRQADASTTRRFGGIGLGLSIVKQLVELHGGSVRAKSRGEGQGATFIVALPLAVAVHDDAARAHPATDEHGSDEGTPPSLAGLTILVVDDEADARALVKRVLEERSARVMTAPRPGRPSAWSRTSGPTCSSATSACPAPTATN